MALPGDRGDREFQKFDLNSAGEVAVRTLTEVTSGTVTGELSISGLHEAIKITTMNVTDTATALPLVPLTNRNSLKVTNLSLNDVLYIGPVSVTADRVIGITSGDEVNPGEGFHIDITDDVVLYGIAESGKTILVKVMEVA